MRRGWYPHTFAAGALAGLALGAHVWAIFVAGVLVGALVVLLVHYGRRLAGLVRELLRSRLHTLRSTGGPLPLRRRRHG